MCAWASLLPQECFSMGPQSRSVCVRLLVPYVVCRASFPPSQCHVSECSHAVAIGRAARARAVPCVSAVSSDEHTPHLAF